jgi:hypothetical protein
MNSIINKKLKNLPNAFPSPRERAGSASHSKNEIAALLVVLNESSAIFMFF